MPLLSFYPLHSTVLAVLTASHLSKTIKLYRIIEVCDIQDRDGEPIIVEVKGHQRLRQVTQILLQNICHSNIQTDNTVV